MNFKKFKRLASVMLSLSMVLSTNMTAFATETNSLPSENTAIVSDETPAECPHDWEFLRYMREPTCTTTGVAIYECQLENCTNIQGLKYEPVPALGHKFDPNAADYQEGEGYTVVENPEATCQQEGTLTFTCQREINGAACNGTKTETTPKTDHEWDEENPKSSPASCTKPAMTYIGCKHCDAIKPDSEQPDTEQPALGHGYERDNKVENTDFTKNTVAATCTTGGYVEYTCLLCADTTEGHTSTPEAEKTPALKHGYARDNKIEDTDFTKSTVNATCTDGGYVEYTCLHCAETTEGHTIKPESEKTPALKHGYERDNAVEGTDYEKETVSATCTTDGYVEYTCKYCADAVEGHTSRPESEKTPALKHGYERTDAVEGTDYEKETVPATCTTDGYVEYTCKHCAVDVEGHTSRPADQIVTGAHIWGTEKVQISEANCKEPAQYDFVCTRCNDKKGETEARGEIDTTKHIWTADPVIFKAETCTANGLGRITCSFCQNDSQIIIIPAGHNYGEWDITPATCTADGSKTRTCQRDTCPDIETEGHAHQEVVSIPATGHDYGENAAESVKTEATCVVKGVVTKTCANGCGTTQDVEGTVDPENHANWSEEGEHAATCTRDRITGVYCTDCGTLGENATSEPGTATGHAFENMTNEQFEETYGPQEDNPDAKSYVEVTKEANCTEAGEKIFTCPTCEASPEEGNTKTVEVSALGHDFKDKYTAPTCTDNGKTQLTCARQGCNATSGQAVDLFVLLGEESEKALGHDPVKIPEVKATCIAPGSTEGVKCQRAECQEVLTATQPIDIDTVNGHDYQETEEIQEWTCTQDGIKEFTCSLCSNVKTETTPAGHDWFVGFSGDEKFHEYVGNADCADDGAILYRVCTRASADDCDFTGDFHGVEVVLEMPGTGLCPTCQKYVWKVTVPGQDATCTEDGFTESETCSSCSHVFKQAEPINALGHKDTTWKVQTAPTCVDAGVEAETCGVCNQPTGVTRPISATGIHKYVDVLVDGDCTHDDTIYSRCETCKQDEPGKAPQVFEGTALGHDFVNDICTRCEKRRIAVSTQFNKYVEDGKNKIRFTSIVEVVDTETYEPIEMGVLYITSKDYDGDGSNLTIEGNTQEPLIVKKQQTNNFNLDGYYVAISVGTSTDRVLWGRGFVKVKNKKTEEEETFYGEIVHGNFINGVVSK